MQLHKTALALAVFGASMSVSAWADEPQDSIDAIMAEPAVMEAQGADYSPEPFVSGRIAAVVDLLTGMDQEVENIVATATDAISGGESEDNSADGSVPVKITGNIPAKRYKCTYNLVGSDNSFNFTNSSFSTFTGKSDGIEFEIACGADREQSASVHLSTSTADPETGAGSSSITGLYTPQGGSEAEPLSLDIYHDKNRDGNGSLIGAQSAADTVAVGGNKRFRLYAQLDKSLVKEGGTITHEGSPSIYVWVR